MVEMLKKYKQYIVLFAYGIVIGDMLQLLQEVAIEYITHKRFNQLVQRHTEEVTEKEQEVTSFVAGDEKLPENG